ncbi:hypothetical protein [Bartonella choladocola]
MCHWGRAIPTLSQWQLWLPIIRQNRPIRILKPRFL